MHSATRMLSDVWDASCDVPESLRSSPHALARIRFTTRCTADFDTPKSCSARRNEIPSFITASAA